MNGKHELVNNGFPLKGVVSKDRKRAIRLCLIKEAVERAKREVANDQ